MTFPILGGNGAVAGYSIDNSIRFNQGDNPRLTRTPSSQGNPRTFTFSCWVKKAPNGTRQMLFGADIPSQANSTYVRFTDDDTLQAYFDYGNNTLEANLNSSAKFRDASAWYHVVWATDTTLSTEADRIKLYVNGVEITDFQSPDYISQNFATDINQTHPHYVGTDTVGVGNDYSVNGYMAEAHFIDGTQLTPTSFGEFDDSGIWKPKAYDGSYGTNGFYLDFENSGSLGADQSGNGNNFTPTNLASTDQTTDTPTNNFCTLSSIYRNGASSNIAPTYSEGNTITNSGGSGTSATRTSSTFEFSSGKWYWEVKVNDSPSAVDIGINNNSIGALCGIRQDGTYFTDNNNQGTLTSFTSSDIISFAFDMDNKKMYIAKNGTYMNSANPSTSTNGISFTTTDSMHCQFKSRQDDSLSANFGNPAFSISSGNSDGNGYGNFEYSVPSGYLALCTQNLATALSPTIDDGSQYFNTVLYTGTGSEKAVTGMGFQPDWTWIKRRDSAYSHKVFDTSRISGTYNEATLTLQTNSSSSENDVGNSDFKSIDSDGFTVLGANPTGASGGTYVGWGWKANGGTTSSNTDGSITSTVQANTTAGFSVVTYTGVSASSGTFGHGLGAMCEMVILKNRTDGNSWVVQHKDFASATHIMNLQDTAGAYDDGSSGITGRSTTTVTVGSGNGVNKDNSNYIAYCFTSIEGYSKIGSYTGNGSSDGTFVYTGFRPAWIMAKRTDAAKNWYIADSARSPNNVNKAYLVANSSNAEDTSGDGTDSYFDILSNGFKLRQDFSHLNASGSTQIYMAFAENPFVSSTGIPVTAR